MEQRRFSEKRSLYSAMDSEKSWASVASFSTDDGVEIFAAERKAQIIDGLAVHVM